MYFGVCVIFLSKLKFPCCIVNKNKDKANRLWGLLFSCWSRVKLPNAISSKSFIFKVMNPPQGMCDLCSLFKPLWITQNRLWFSYDLRIPICSTSYKQNKDILLLQQKPPHIFLFSVKYDLISWWNWALSGLKGVLLSRVV